MSDRQINEFAVFKGVSLQTGEPDYYDYLKQTLYASGPNTTGFRSQRWKKHALPVNDYVLSSVQISPGSTSQHARYHVYDEFGNESTVQLDGLVPYYAPAHTQDNVLVDKCSNSAISALNSNMKGASFNAAQAMGERKQVVDLLATTARRLTSSFSSLRRGDLIGCVSSLGIKMKYVQNRSRKSLNDFRQNRTSDPFKAASDLWLELQYGWKPLIQDVYESTKIIAERNVNNGNDLFFSNNTVSSQRSLSDTLTNIVNSGSGPDLTVFTTIIDYKYTSRLKVTYRVENEFLRYSSMFGMTNPALLAWELTPFSFVVDWFLPIGNYLSNSQANYGLSFVKGSQSSKFTSRTRGFGYSGDSSSFGSVFTETSSGDTIVQTYNRSSMSSFPQEPLPSFKNPVSIGHTANAIALLVSVFKR